MLIMYEVQILRNGTWEPWSCYLYKRLAEGVRLRREQEGLVARVEPVTVDYASPLSQGLPEEPMRCLYCHHPEGDPAPCLPGYHHGYVTRRPGQSSVQAEDALFTQGGA